jgi:hypothetical protein
VPTLAILDLKDTLEGLYFPRNERFLHCTLEGGRSGTRRYPECKAQTSDTWRFWSEGHNCIEGVWHSPFDWEKSPLREKDAKKAVLTGSDWQSCGLENTLWRREVCGDNFDLFQSPVHYINESEITEPNTCRRGYAVCKLSHTMI